MSTYSRPASYLPPATPVPYRLRPQAPAPPRPAPPVASKPAAAVAKAEEPKVLEPLARLRHLPVKLTFANGSVLEGRLVENWKYELVINPSPGRLITVLKHAVATVEEVTP